MRKVKLAYIEDRLRRKATFNRRSKGLLKKVEEISILCDVPASAIIYNPDDSKLIMWPSRYGVETVISNPRTVEERKERKRMMDQYSFLRERIDKESEKLEKLQKKNRNLELREMMFQCLNGDMSNLHVEDLKDLVKFINKELNCTNSKLQRSANDRAEEMRRQQLVNCNHHHHQKHSQQQQNHHHHHEHNQQQQNHHHHEHIQQQQNHHHHHQHNQRQQNHHHHEHIQQQQNHFHHHQYNQKQQNHHHYHKHNQQQQNHHHHHQHNQQQRNPDNSSIAFGQYFPPTNPNAPNNIWI